MSGGYINGTYLSIAIDIDDISIEVLLDYINSRVPRDSSYVLHEHAVHEIYYIEAGQMRFECEDTTHELRAGSLFVIPAGSRHRSVECSDDLSWFCVRFRFDENFDDRFLACRCLENRAEVLAGVISAIRAFVPGEQSKLAICRLKANLTLLFCELLEHFTIAQSPSQSSLCADSKLVLYSIIDSFLGANCHRHITVDDLADYIGYSRMQTHRIVVECCGMSFTKKLREVRIRNAKRLLMIDRLSIDEVAERCGYDTRKGFESAFQNYTGKLPAAYRREYRPM